MPRLSDAHYARLATEVVNPRAAKLDTMSAAAIVRLMADEELASPRAVARAAPAIARVAEAAARAITGGRRIIYLGAGTSGRLAALDAAECPPTFGTRPAQVVAIVAGGARALRRAVEGAEDRGDDAVRALRRRRAGAGDVVVGIAASGVTPFVVAGLAEARRAGAFTALVTCARVTADVDVVVRLAVGPEVLAGSTRLKAGTATKLALNAISTAAMVRAGKCYGPYMVDLVATSAKLRARARRLLARLGQLDASPAVLDRRLAAAGGRVDTAVVMARLDLDRTAAEARLRAAGGRLRVALGEP